MPNVPRNPDRIAESYQRMVADIYPRLAQLIVQRYQSYVQKSLKDVYNLDQDFLQVEPDAVEFTTAYRKEIIAILEDPQLFSSLVRLFVISTLEFTYANNQFVQVDGQKEHQLSKIYQGYLSGMKNILAAESSPDAIQERFQDLIHEHFVNLRHNLANYLDHDGRQVFEDNMLFNQVVCRQYSPEFQLKILGTSPNQLLEPVLDIGCGKSGELVHYLNALGIQTIGIDRIVEHSDTLIAADWLNFKLEPSSWGTIISHMAFSNHFIFHHFYNNGNPEPFARQYMAILAALLPGGSFYYSPGLPFIEDLLPRERYTVTQHKVTEAEGRQSAVHKFEDEELYTTRVIKNSSN